MLGNQLGGKLEIEIAEGELANRRRGHVLEGRTGPFQVKTAMILAWLLKSIYLNAYF
jgi:hypothetical protein